MRQRVTFRPPLKNGNRSALSDSVWLPLNSYDQIRSGANRITICNLETDPIYWVLDSSDPASQAVSGAIPGLGARSFPWEAMSFLQAGGRSLRIQGHTNFHAAYILQEGKAVSTIPFYKPLADTENVAVTTDPALLSDSVTIPVGTIRGTIINIHATDRAYWSYGSSDPVSISSMAVIPAGEERVFEWEAQYFAKLWLAGAGSQNVHVLFEGR